MQSNQRPHIILYGITGEPLQNGHLETYLSLVDQYGNDNTSVYILPNAVPRYKNNRMDLTLKQRMYQTIITKLPRDNQGNHIFRFMLCELLQECAPGGFNVLTYLKSKYPHRDFSLAIGMDSFLTFDTAWSNWQQIPQLCNLIVMERQGYPSDAFTQQENFIRQTVTGLGYCCGSIQLHNPKARKLSSSECAKKLERGEDCRNDIPKPCLDFIYKNKGCFRDFATPKPDFYD